MDQLQIISILIHFFLFHYHNKTPVEYRAAALFTILDKVGLVLYPSTQP